MILLNLNGAESSVKKLFQFVMDNLLPISSSETTPLLNSLAILHQMVSASHQLVASKEDEITTFLVSLIKTNSVCLLIIKLAVTKKKKTHHCFHVDILNHCSKLLHPERERRRQRSYGRRTRILTMSARRSCCP